MGTTSTAIAVYLAALCLDPVEDIACDDVDLIEINHFYDGKGNPVFDQIIFYDWCSVENRYQVRDFKLLKNPAQIPYRHWRRQRYTAVWYDGDVLRKVYARNMRESWTQYDPELTERHFLPKEKRRKLRNVRMAKNLQTTVSSVR